MARVQRPGEAACCKWACQCLRNDSGAVARYLAGGARSAEKVVATPDHDRVHHRAADGAARFTMLARDEGVGSAYTLPGARSARVIATAGKSIPAPRAMVTGRSPPKPRAR